jgi:CO/xanthine dehydrogenase FAD-binding subunit
MQVLRPTDWPTALALYAEHPDATPINGGTDVMRALRDGRLQPGTLLDLSLVTELRSRQTDGDATRIGAGVTYTDLAERVGGPTPGLAAVARVIGSRQIRNRGTLGGCLGTANPAADPHPMLLATGAEVELHSVRGARRVPVGEFYTAARERDELIAAVRVPVAAGAQWFDRVGVRRGMVKSICSCAIVVDGKEKRVAVAIGGCGPAPVRASAAEELVRGHWDTPLDDELVAEFGRLVAAAGEPADDVLATAAYRRHAVAVLARRGLRTVWEGGR